jgi:hypothetical protein
MPEPEDLSFDAVTALQDTDDPSVFGASIHPLWAVGDKPNGGYLLAVLGRAARVVAGREGGEGWEVVSSSVTYLRAPGSGPARVRAPLLRRGRTAAHVRAVLSQGDDLVDAVFVLGDLADRPAVRYDGIVPFSAPEPEDCVRLTPQVPNGVYVGIMDVLDLRLDPTTLPFTATVPAPAGTPAELRGWTRFNDGRPADALSLLFLTDAIPPATLMIGSTGWVPTLQLSTYVRARPAPGWLGIRMTAGLVADGMVDETCVLWDSRGHLVGQSTQLARLRFPDEV